MCRVFGFEKTAMFCGRWNIFKYMPMQSFGRIPIQKNYVRTISTEFKSAMRPLYFAVHPDRFSQHPTEREVNENSLMQLSAHVEALEERRYYVQNECRVLKFFIRDAKANECDTFKKIEFKLDPNMRDPRYIIETLLKLCGLSAPRSSKKSATKSMNRKTAASYSNSKSSSQNAEYEFRKTNHTRDYTYNKKFMNFSQKVNNETSRELRQSLITWIEENSDLAKTRAKCASELKEKVDRLRIKLMQRLHLKDLRFNCGWNYDHFRGSLKSLERLANTQENDMPILKNRIVVFAPFTGVSLEGHIMLFTGDVLDSWIDFIHKIPEQYLFLEKIPKYESTLSQVLLNIKIGRRKFMPEKQAVEYAGHLLNVTTTLGDYLTTSKFPNNWPRTLSEFELVIESEAGPLMVSPTGQLIIPATCPGFLLIDFISSNMSKARELKRKYNDDKHLEKELIQRCKEILNLKDLTKDNSVSPDRMIETIRKLVKCKSGPFNDLRLYITNYYSVSSDGTVCIPWDLPASPNCA